MRLFAMIVIARNKCLDCVSEPRMEISHVAQVYLGVAIGVPMQFVASFILKPIIHG